MGRGAPFKAGILTMGISGISGISRDEWIFYQDGMISL